MAASLYKQPNPPEPAERHRSPIRIPTVAEPSEYTRPEALLDDVCDRESFIAFVQALAGERELAQEIERDNPDRYIVDGALGWMNGDIPQFLGAALDYFAERPLKEPIPDQPTWKMFAEMLWCGKIIE